MSFFKNLFGKKPSEGTKPVDQYNTDADNETSDAVPPINDPAFEAFFSDALARYMDRPGAQVTVDFGMKDGSIVSKERILSDAYNECSDIQSVWDKRSVIYALLDELEEVAALTRVNESDGIVETLEMVSLTRAQIMERLIIDRHPEYAGEMGTKGDDSDYEDADYMASFARALFFSGLYENVIEVAGEALEIEPENKRARIVMADALHLEGRHDEAHEYYNSILRETLPEDTEMTLSVYDIVCFHGNILPSSVYAVALLQESDEAMWNAVAEEFYHCAFFRTQHAFWLFKNDENHRGLAKLVSVTQEFPSYKEAVVNAHNVIRQFRSQYGNPSLMQEEFVRLEKIMREEGWKAVGD